MVKTWLLWWKIKKYFFTWIRSKSLFHGSVILTLLNQAGDEDCKILSYWSVDGNYHQYMSCSNHRHLLIIHSQCHSLSHTH